MLKAALITPRLIDFITEKNNGFRPADELMRHYDHILIYSDDDPEFIPQIMPFDEFCRDYRWTSLQDNYNAIEKV